MFIVNMAINMDADEKAARSGEDVEDRQILETT
jgi:hypothetical protein